MTKNKLNKFFIIVLVFFLSFITYAIPLPALSLSETVLNLPQEKTIFINPRAHKWFAYEYGRVIRSGIATTGSRTKTGTFRLYHKGDVNCPNKPYCMYFSGSQAIYGDKDVARGSLSQGDVRLHMEDAEWLNLHFVEIGTRVIVGPY
jgi:hypothetical protein